jgi:hypothetical protein
VADDRIKQWPTTLSGGLTIHFRFLLIFSFFLFLFLFFVGKEYSNKLKHVNELKNNYKYKYKNKKQ